MESYSKNKVLALYRILVKHTDENHQISMQEILTFLENSGYSCSEDSVLRYIKQLKNELEVDIISGRGRNAKYFVGERLLEKEELKLIVDSINASNFIEKKIAGKMVDKLKRTLSIYEAEDLDRNVFGISNTKTENKKILYNVNKIQEAFNRDVQIKFHNRGWDKNKKLKNKNDWKNTLNPWALIWANDRYYLYGFDVEEKGGKLGERHYRVDKLADVELLDSPRKGKNQFRSFNANTYVSRRIGMFSGIEELITVKIPEDLIGAFIDQFGTRILIQEHVDDLIITFKAVVSDMLLGWLVGLGRGEVLEPYKARDKMINLLKQNKDYYN